MFKPPFLYFGTKYRLAPLYGPPTRSVVVESFAGAAAYSCYWEVEKALLFETDPVVYGIWDWLINHATFDDIMDLDGDLIDLADPIANDYPQAARDLIGFCMAVHPAKPVNRLAPRNLKIKKAGKGFWSEKMKVNLAMNLHKFVNWEVYLADYSTCPNENYFYFVDPPYQFQGSHYRCGSKGFDYNRLADWCLSRNGDVVIAEASPANWMPFDMLQRVGNQRGDNYNELIWRKDSQINPNLFE